MDAATRRMIEERHVGGIIFFKPNLQNSSQMLSLSNQLKKANRDNPLPLWLSLDEEGGRVNRLPDEFAKLPTNLKIGKANSTAFSKQIGGKIGEVLHGFGYNLNFAPVLDVNSNPDNPVIGDRSFSSSPSRVGTLGVATLQGLAEQQVIPVVKHFPGHGDTSVDSHIGLPVVNYGRDRLDQIELVPFKKAVQAGADAVMVAHILLPKFDDTYPASFSKAIIGGMLRKDLGFQGVVFTDDMTMGAVAEHYDLGDAAVRSILAGGDVVLVCHDDAKEQAVLDALTQAVKDGRITAERLNESVERIARLKLKYGLTDKPAPGADAVAFNQGVASLLKRYLP
ncbi:beta-N-acetylhexosaminidase [Gorillibacterium sp. sgz500922]|uniref:beta-N-acetylhexosaminidase n=1 Tax=Gorillibacterium sp. sgz500922 TaxID=3446694 RepID=UPI003F67F490